MKLHFLGTTGYHPNESRQTACLMIPEVGVIFDAGTGIFRARDLICTPTLDIFLSHTHLDHSIGLTFLYDILFGKEDVKSVTVHVAAEKIDSIREHLYAKDLFPVGPNFEFNPLSEGHDVKLADGSVVTHHPLVHPGGSTGFRLEHKTGSLAYITDTTATADAPYIDFIRDVDLLVHECYFPDGWEDRAALTGHSCLTPVAQVAAASGAKATWLVHINPLDASDQPFDLESVGSICDRLQVASDRQIVDL